MARVDEQILQLKLDELERVNAELNDTLAFLLAGFQMHSPKMDGQHSWRFRNSGWPWTHARGPTAIAAVRSAMAEVRRANQEP